MQIEVQFQGRNFCVSHVRDDIWIVDKYVWHPQVDFLTRRMIAASKEEIQRQFCGDLMLCYPFNIDAAVQFVVRHRVFMERFEKVHIITETEDECCVCLESVDKNAKHIVCYNLHWTCLSCKTKLQICPLCRNKFR